MASLKELKEKEDDLTLVVKAVTEDTENNGESRLCKFKKLIDDHVIKSDTEVDRDQTKLVNLYLV